MCNTLASELVRFEDIRASSLTVILNSDYSNMGNVVGYSLWHRKADDKDYPSEPTCRLFKSNTKFLLSGLSTATEYFLKVVILDTDREMGFHEFQFRTESSQDGARNKNSEIIDLERSQSPATNCSSFSNPSSVEDETSNPMNEDENRTADLPVKALSCLNQSQKEDNNPGNVVISLLEEEKLKGQMIEATSTDNGSDLPTHTGLECVPYVESSEAGLPITPCKFENLKEDNGRSNRPKSSNGQDTENGSKRVAEPQAGSSSKKRSGERRQEECTGIGDKEFEYYVKVVRWLECEGHIETAFRQKFLTWYSLRATSQEVRVVKVFIDTFIEDPESLAGQLVDTFSDVISNKRCSASVRAGFCMKLWH